MIKYHDHKKLTEQEFILAYSSRGKAYNIQESMAWWQEQEADYISIYIRREGGEEGGREVERLRSKIRL